MNRFRVRLVEWMYFIWIGVAALLSSYYILFIGFDEPEKAETVKTEVTERSYTQVEKEDEFTFMEEREEKEKEMEREENNKELLNAKKKAYITIDDGPSKYTSDILDVLNHHKVSGTFFFVGQNMKLLSDELAENLKENQHSVGPHSMTHDKAKIYDKKLFTEENKQVFDLLEEHGFQSDIVRAPYGSTYLSDAQLKEIRKESWVLLDWNIDSLDWKLRNVNKTYDHIVKQIPVLEKKGETELIILLHEKPETAAILDKLIPTLKEKGYVLVSGEQVPFNELVFRGR